MIVLGECLEVMKTLDAQSVDMVYVDPPFFTQKVHRLTPRSGDRAYEFGDVWRNIEAYKDFIRPRLKECHRLLKDTGSIFLQCHWAASHHLRLLLDEVLGGENFQSEIVWAYRRWSNSKKGLLNAHQTIYFYRKSANFKFRRMYQEYSLTTNLDQILQKRERGENGKARYKRSDNGDVVVGGAKRGVPLSDVWALPYLNPKANERTGYPTQKPLHLMERLISLVTDEGDTVLDPFCGSGSTVLAARLLSRKFIGIDSSKEAIDLTQRRLERPVRSQSGLIQKGVEAYFNQEPDVVRLLSLIDALPVQRNKGIDGFLKQEYRGKPVPVRVQRPWETVDEAESLFLQACKGKGCLKRILIVTNPISSSLVLDKGPMGSDLIRVPAPRLSVSTALEEAGWLGPAPCGPSGTSE